MGCSWAANGPLMGILLGRKWAFSGLPAGPLMGC